MKCAKGLKLKSVTNVEIVRFKLRNCAKCLRRKCEKVWESLRKFEKVWKSLRKFEKVWESIWDGWQSVLNKVRESLKNWESIKKYDNVLKSIIKYDKYDIGQGSQTQKDSRAAWDSK